MRTALILLLAATLTACAAAPQAAAPTPTAATPTSVVADRLRPITGAQVCAALPEALRKSLLSDDTLHDDIMWSNDVATATEVWGKCGWYYSAPRSLSVTVQASGTATQTATDHAKQVFEKSKADAVEKAEKPDLSGWKYTPPVAADHGDDAFTVTATRTRSSDSRYAYIGIRQGPWLISITYQGEEHDGALPAGADLRRGADQVAAVFTAEMAKDPGTVAVEDGTVCGAISTAQVASAFFPSVTEVSGLSDDYRVSCTWTVRDHAEKTNAPCGRGVIQLGDVVPRCGELRISFRDVTRHDDRDPKVVFPGHAESYADEPSFKRLTGLGDRAFVVADQVHVLVGDHLVILTFDGMNIGGGVRDAPGYEKPDVDEAALRKSLIQIAEIFVRGMSDRI